MMEQGHLTHKKILFQTAKKLKTKNIRTAAHIGPKYTSAFAQEQSKNTLRSVPSSAGRHFSFQCESCLVTFSSQSLFQNLFLALPFLFDILILKVSWWRQKRIKDGEFLISWIRAPCGAADDENKDSSELIFGVNYWTILPQEQVIAFFQTHNCVMKSFHGCHPNHLSSYLAFAEGNKPIFPCLVTFNMQLIANWWLTWR